MSTIIVIVRKGMLHLNTVLDANAINAKVKEEMLRYKSGTVVSRCVYIISSKLVGIILSSHNILFLVGGTVA